MGADLWLDRRLCVEYSLIELTRAVMHLPTWQVHVYYVVNSISKVNLRWHGIGTTILCCMLHVLQPFATPSVLEGGILV